MSQMRTRGFLFRWIALAGLGALAAVASAQTPTQPVSIIHLRDGVSWASGGVGSNSGVIVGKNGVVVVDAKMTADSAKEELAAIAKMTSKPVTAVIITHSDQDHVGGLAGYPKGLMIIAQANCKKEMEESEHTKQPAPADYMPTRTVNRRETVTLDGVRMELLHWAPAHTSGDLVIYLPQQKIAFTGDIVAAQVPIAIIHTPKHGTTTGWVETMKGILALNANLYVPGHGPVQTRAQLEARLHRGEARRARVKQLVAQGKSLDEIKKELGESDAGARFASFTEVVYDELTKKKG
jgi:glyoxylase-like metal-dependent hydrolase (beta-lactamase superfamily II)